MLKRFGRVSIYAAGALFCGLILLSRLPGMYNAMWEDPVHHQFAYLSVHNFYQLQHSIARLYQTMLDVGLRKWFWFSSIGFPMTEMHISLVSLLYSGVHLLLFLFVPWTPFMGLRLLACGVLGLCPVETTYAVQAQGYSLTSLAPTVFLFSFLGSTSLFTKVNVRPAVGVFLGGWALMLNAYILAWPMAFAVWAFYAAYLWSETRLQEERRTGLRFLVFGSVGLFLLTVALNMFSIHSLLVYPPAANNGSLHVNWAIISSGVAQTWTALHVKSWIYLPVLAAGAFHPIRSRRYLSLGLIVSLIVVKFLLLCAMTWRSSYAVSDRYLIMFISPSIIAASLGVESLALNLATLRRSAGVLFPWGCLLLVAGLWHQALQELPAKAVTGVSVWKATPPNHSRNFQFFEHLKAAHQPTLVLTNHPYATDIPTFYLRYIAQPISSPLTILNVYRDCETSDAQRIDGIKTFLSRYRETGQVAFFYETLHGEPDPCQSRIPMQHTLPQKGGCLAVYSAGSIEPFLLKNEARKTGASQPLK